MPRNPIRKEVDPRQLDVPEAIRDEIVHKGVFDEHVRGALKEEGQEWGSAVRSGLMAIVADPLEPVERPIETVVGAENVLHVEGEHGEEAGRVEDEYALVELSRLEDEGAPAFPRITDPVAQQELNELAAFLQTAPVEVTQEAVVDEVRQRMRRRVA